MLPHYTDFERVGRKGRRKLFFETCEKINAYAVYWNENFEFRETMMNNLCVLAGGYPTRDK